MGGRDLLSAGYVMYSSSTVLVLSVGYGVVGFTLDNLIGDFVMTHADIKIPETGKIYSFNEGNAANWSEGLKNYMSHVKAPEGRAAAPNRPATSAPSWATSTARCCTGASTATRATRRTSTGSSASSTSAPPSASWRSRPAARAPPATAA